MQKKIEIKKEIEKLSNKSLTIFTVALFCEVILMFLASALNGSGAYRSGLDDFVSVTCGVCLGAFILMVVAYFVMKNKKVNVELTKQFMNWGYVVLAVSVGSFFISAPTISPAVFSFIGLTNLGGALAVKMVRFSGTTASDGIMVIVAIYVVAMFVYYNMKANKIKKSK